VFRPLVTVAAALALLGGCSRQEAPAAAPAAAGPVAAAAEAAPAAAPAATPAIATAAAAETTAATPAPTPVAAAAPAREAKAQSVDIFADKSAPAAASPSHNAGKVVQTAEGGGYTYAEVKMASGQKVWIAGSHIQIKPGSEVEWGNYALMRDFQARSLGKTFPEILFVDRWNVVGQAPVAVAPHGQFPGGEPAASADQMAAAAAGAAPAAADPSARGTVKTVTNAAGYSYIEVDQGAGKTVWVAAMQTPMKAGDKVQWQGGTQMSNFTARSLGRTFDKIIFAQGVSVGQ